MDRKWSRPQFLCQKFRRPVIRFFHRLHAHSHDAELEFTVTNVHEEAFLEFRPNRFKKIQNETFSNELDFLPHGISFRRMRKIHLFVRIFFLAISKFLLNRFFFCMADTRSPRFLRFRKCWWDHYFNTGMIFWNKFITQHHEEGKCITKFHYLQVSRGLLRVRHCEKCQLVQWALHSYHFMASFWVCASDTFSQSNFIECPIIF